jgi:predicted phage tail protein
MGEKEIREKYGGKLAKAINRAIRAEVTGGNEALDKLTQLAGPALHSHWKDRTGKDTVEAAAYFKHKREVVDRMESEIRKRWGIPPDRTKQPKPASARGTRPPASKLRRSPRRGGPSR